MYALHHIYEAGIQMRLFDFVLLHVGTPGPAKPTSMHGSFQQRHVSSVRRLFVNMQVYLEMGDLFWCIYVIQTLIVEDWGTSAALPHRAKNWKLDSSSAVVC